MYPLLGLLGGTFDPIHEGHINIATALMHQLNLTQVEFIPCQRSPHREQPIASATDRLNMLKIATEKNHRFTVNPIELEQPDPSYTINTLKKIHEQQPNATLCFILAMDAFAHFNQWYQWQEILNHCHLILANRAGFSPPKDDWFRQLCKHHGIKTPEALQESRTGKILITEISPFLASATQIRSALAEENSSAIASQLPDGVLKYIQTHRVYNA